MAGGLMQALATVYDASWFVWPIVLVFPWLLRSFPWQRMISFS